MKSKLLKLTVAALMVFTIKVQAQAPTYSPAVLGAAIINDGFESWAGTPTQPTFWMQPPTTTMPASAVVPTSAATSTTASPLIQSGTMSCNLQNTTTTYSYIATAATFPVTAGMAYQISYYARGKGTISSGIATGTVNTAPGGEPVSGKTWHHYIQSVVAPTTGNAAFFLKVKSTGVYSSGGVSVTGIDVDSFVVNPYTPRPMVDLYSLQYTTLSNGNSPFFGQYVGMTGGIVTAVTVGSTGANGYYVQTTGSHVWAGMQVFDFTNVALVNVGDSITFGGTVDEFYGMTQMGNITNFVNVSAASGNHYNIMETPLTMQTMAVESEEAILANIQNASYATATSYSANYGQATMTDGSGVSGLVDLKDGFYAPNGSATAGSSGNGGYAPSVGVNYCFEGIIYYSFGFNIMPRDSQDVHKNCTVLGISNHTNNLNASIYPNPVNNQLTVKLPMVANKVSVSFTDVLGKEVITMNNLSGSEVSVNDINLPAGVYVVKVVADGNTQITKIIKQ